MTGSYPVPLGQAFPATRARGVLGDEDRMASHRRLLTVVWRKGKSQPLSNELVGMFTDSRQAFLFDVFDVPF